MENKFDIWILESLENGTLYAGKKLPSESVLEKQFNITKQLLKKTIAKYLSLGIFISFQGKGVYISPLWDKERSHYRFIPIMDNVIDRTKTIVKKKDITLYPMLDIINEYIDLEYKPNEWEVFTKEYFSSDGEVVAYSINWINKKSQFGANFFKKNPTVLYEDIFKISLYQSEVVLLAPTLYDKEIFNNAIKEHTPTSFSFIFEKSIIPTMVREIKVLPKYFQLQSKMSKINFK